jgi:excisionase family DNA binding protein
MGEPERLYTRKQSSERLNCSLSTVERLIRQGEIPRMHMGRKTLIRESALERRIEAQEER